MNKKRSAAVLVVVFGSLLLTGIALANEIPEGMLLGLPQDQIHEKLGSPQSKYIYDSASEKKRYYTLEEWNSMGDKDGPGVEGDFYRFGRLDNALEYHIQYRTDPQTKELRVLRYTIEFEKPAELGEIAEYVPEFIPVTKSDTRTYYRAKKGKLIFKLVETSEVAASISRGFETDTNGKECSFMYEWHLASPSEEVSLDSKASELRIDVSSTEGENLLYTIGIWGERIGNPFLSEPKSKRVKTKIEYWYDFVEKFGRYEPELKHKTVYQYDTEGNLIKETMYSPDIGVLHTESFEYDEKGNKIAKETKYPWKRELERTVYKYKYDQRGNKIEEAAYDGDGNLKHKWIYKYDERGKRVEAIYHSVEYSFLDGKCVYKYDGRGNEIEEIEYGAHGNLEHRWTSEYDEEGREIKSARYNEKNELTGQWSSEYDEKGREIKRTGYDNEGNKTIVGLRKYDENGNQIEAIMYEYKSVSGKIEEVPKTKRTYEYYAEEVPSKEHTFRKTTWGMSKEQVKEAEVGRIVYDAERTLGYEGSIAGLGCMIAYIFTEGKLVRAKYVITEEHSNRNDYISDYETLKEGLAKKYGEPISDERLWKRDLYKDDPQRWGFAISIGDLAYFARWETLQTEIILGLHGDNYDITLVVEYVSRELEELEEKEEEQRLLEQL